MSTTAHVDIIDVDRDPPWTDLDVREHVADGVLRWAILEEGTLDGRPSVMLAVPTAEGWVVAETTYAIFEMIAGAFRGAAEKWEQEP